MIDIFLLADKNLYRDLDDDLYNFLEEDELTIDDVIRDPSLLEQMIRDEKLIKVLNNK